MEIRPIEEGVIGSDGQVEKAGASVVAKRDFGFVPIPRWCREIPSQPVVLSHGLGIAFALTSALTVANLYYNQPLLVRMSEYFKVPYDTVTHVPSLLQAGYCVGLVFLTPLSDLVPRRPFILLLLFATATLSLALATVTSFQGFEAISFLTGFFTVTPQVLVPLAADLAPAHRRSAAVSLVVSGLVGGMVFGRLFGGLLGRFASTFQSTYFLAAGVQYALLLLLWLVMPSLPRKTTNMSYPAILWSMVKLMVSEPLLIQASFIGYLSGTILASWWTTLTFLLENAPFHYNSFETGLFGLCGLCTIFCAPYFGRLNDKLVPWTGTLIGIAAQFLTATIACAAAGVNVGPVVIVCICTDLAHQIQQIGNQTRIYSIDPLSRGRLNGCYMMFVFLGQTTGSSGGSKLFLRSGWRAAYALNMACSATGMLILLLRGPHAKGWIGWSGQYTLRKLASMRASEVPVEEQTAVDSIDLKERSGHLQK